MDYTPNIDAQGMRRPMGPVDQPNWNGGLQHAAISYRRSDRVCRSDETPL